MSALGPTRTSRPSCGMSVLPPTTDIVSQTGYIRKVPKADILRGGSSFGRGGHDFHLLVKNNARERIELASPGRTIENRPGMGISGLPSLPDAGRTEVDVLGVVLAIELRRQQPHHMHPRRTTVTGQFLHRIAVTLGRR